MSEYELTAPPVWCFADLSLRLAAEAARRGSDSSVYAAWCEGLYSLDAPNLIPAGSTLSAGSGWPAQRMVTR